MLKSSLLASIALFLSIAINAQTKISGTVIDDSSSEPVSAAVVVVQGTNDGTSVNAEGTFNLSTSVTNGVVVIKCIGYQTQNVSFKASGSMVNLGEIRLSEDANTMMDLVIVGQGVVDLAQDRQTPIAVSTITSKEIQDKAANWDLPEVLKSTPSVQNIKGGGFGDGSMFLRGFDQTNTAFLINGQPINGMEDGKMYWSNWSGVLDIANAVQVQRGLGSSKLAISSVGGTVNIVTKTVDMKEGGFINSMVANNNYYKASAYYSTGLMKSGWAVAAMFGHWQGDGYVDYTSGQGQTYFLSVGYKPSEKHIFNFFVTGAPQWHAAAGSGSLQSFLDNGIQYNNWNYDINGKKYAGGRNFYHKPISNITWDWKINEKSNLSTVVYGSIGRGGFASVLTSSGVPTYARGSYNNHNWYGAVSSFNHKINENLQFNIGADIRYYNGVHFRGATEFFSVESVNSTNTALGTFTVNNTFGGYNPWQAVFNSNNAHDQRIGYDYEEVINYQGVFGQLEYAKNGFSTFFQGAFSSQSHLKTDYWNYDAPKDAEKVTNPGYNVKAGAAYEIDENSKIFANAGYYSRQPFHDNLFRNIRVSNDLFNPQVTNQDIIGLEAGYQLRLANFSANINVYNTVWDNRTLLGDNGQSDPTLVVYYQTQGVKQIHQGVEFDMMYQVTSDLQLKGYLSAGDWRYSGNASIRAFNDAGDDITNTLPAATLDLDGVKVGGAAQTTAGLGANYNLGKGFKVDGQLNYYNSLYANVGTASSTIALPQYQTFDFGISYKVFVGNSKKNSIQFRGNVNNFFDTKYLESASTNIPVVEGANVWKGVNTANTVRFGYGRTWNVSLRYNF